MILDFFRTSRLIHSPTSTISLKSILLEANYYSIDLSFAFCGNLIEGVYVSESVNGAEIIYIEVLIKYCLRFIFSKFINLEFNVS